MFRGGELFVVESKRTSGEERRVTRALESACRMTRFSSQVPFGKVVRMCGVRGGGEG